MSTPSIQASGPSANAGPDERALFVSIHAGRTFDNLRAEIFTLCKGAFEASEAKGRRDAASDLRRAGFAEAAAFLTSTLTNSIEQRT